MKHTHQALALFLAAAPLASCNAFGGKHAINIHGGGRDLHKAADSVSDQGVVGGEVVLGLGDSGWALEGQGFYSEGDSPSSTGFDSKLQTKELAVGARHTFLRKSPVRPYLGLGVNWMEAELENPAFPSQKDDGIGGYAHVGVLAAILSFQVGLDVRGGLSGAELGGDRQDYAQATIFLGLTW